MPLLHATRHCANYTSLRYNYDCVTLRDITRYYTRLQYAIPHYSTQHYNSTLHYTTLATPHNSDSYNCNPLHYNCNCNYNCTHYTTSSSCGEVTTETIATPPNNTTPTTFWSISGLLSAICDPQQRTSPIGMCPIFETPATALRRTTRIPD